MLSSSSFEKPHSAAVVLANEITLDSIASSRNLNTRSCECSLANRTQTTHDTHTHTRARTRAPRVRHWCVLAATSRHRLHCLSVVRLLLLLLQLLTLSLSWLLQQ
jgi:hypothetical protein